MAYNYLYKVLKKYDFFSWLQFKHFDLREFSKFFIFFVSMKQYYFLNNIFFSWAPPILSMCYESFNGSGRPEMIRIRNPDEIHKIWLFRQYRVVERTRYCSAQTVNWPPWEIMRMARSVWKQTWCAGIYIGGGGTFVKNSKIGKDFEGVTGEKGKGKKGRKEEGKGKKKGKL